MYNRRYDKILIQMKQDTHGFSTGERSVSGSCTIEIKNNTGTLRFYIKDLRKPKSIDFYLYGISVSKNSCEGIFICNVTPDKTGFFEYQVNFEPDNFMNTQKEIEKINVFAVISKRETEEEPLLVPACGYTDLKINWKNRFKIFDKNSIENINDVIEIEDYKELESVFEDSDTQEGIEDIYKEKTISAAENPNHNNTIHSTECVAIDKIYNPEKITLMPDISEILKIPSADIFSTITKRFKEEMELLEKNGVFTKEDIENIMSSGKKSNKLSKANKSNNKELDIIFKENKKINLPNSEVDWIICDIKESILLPQNNISEMKNPFILYSYKKYGHIIIGRNNENNIYYIGIPDYYNSDYTLTASHLGFKTFIHKNTDNKGWGYWIKEIY